MQLSLSILALVLSLAFHGPAYGHSVDLELFGHDSLSSRPQLDANHAQSQTSKETTKLNLFGPLEFDQLSLIHSLQTSLQNFAFYLPIYRLIRKKEYFLLI
jgi:hypothetical protein